MIAQLKRFDFIELALIAAAGASAALLAGAHVFEALGYPPCTLCLDQREAHWTALAIAVAGIVAQLGLRARLVAAAAVGATALVYAVSAGLAFFHAGVEFGYWPGPASCSAVGAGAADPADLERALNSRTHGPSCDEASWRLFGVSMAGYNLLFSAGLFALTLGAALKATRAAKDARRPHGDAAEGAV